jgi:hypothetical protein
MVDTITMIKKRSKHIQEYVNQIERVLYETKSEISKCRQNLQTIWDLVSLQEVIIPEIEELFFYAKKGEIYYKYGENQRMLLSTHLLTDSMAGLSRSQLGVEILALQEIYNRF